MKSFETRVSFAAPIKKFFHEQIYLNLQIYAIYEIRAIVSKILDMVGLNWHIVY